MSYIRKQIGGQLRPTRQVCRNKFLRGQRGRQRERKFCVRALPASSAGRQIGGQLRPTRQVRRKKQNWGTQKTTGAQVQCASSACEFCWQTNWGPTEANRTSFPTVRFWGTTGYHESASSVCELCLPVLLAARRRAHKSIAAQVCVSKRTCGPTSAPEAQNRPLVDFIKKSRGGPRGLDQFQKFATARGDKGQSKHTTPPEPLAQALFGEKQQNTKN